MLKKILFGITSFFVFAFFSFNLVSADNFGLTYEKLNPDSILYPAKRLTENIWMKVKGEGAKNQLMATYTDRRFKELIYMFDKGKTGFYAEVVSRYNSSVGRAKEEFGETSLVKQKKNDYVKILEKLRDNYPANSSPWLLVQQTIDVTNSQ